MLLARPRSARTRPRTVFVSTAVRALASGCDHGGVDLPGRVPHLRCGFADRVLDLVFPASSRRRARQRRQRRRGRRTAAQAMGADAIGRRPTRPAPPRSLAPDAHALAFASSTCPRLAAPTAAVTGTGTTPPRSLAGTHPSLRRADTRNCVDSPLRARSSNSRHAALYDFDS